jgi:hypothetical protein
MSRVWPLEESFFLINVELLDIYYSLIKCGSVVSEYIKMYGTNS